MNEFQQRIGVGQRCVALGRTADTRTRSIVAEEGPRRGREVGTETDHKNGRVDATVFAPSTTITTKTQEL